MAGNDVLNTAPNSTVVQQLPPSSAPGTGPTGVLHPATTGLRGILLNRTRTEVPMSESFITLNFAVPETPNAVDYCRERVVGILQQLKSLFPSISLMSFSADNHSSYPPLSSFDLATCRLPFRASEIAKYAFPFNVSPGKALWTNVRIRHPQSVTFSTMKSDMSAWLTSSRILFLEKRVQSESSKVVGFLLYSLMNYPVEALSEELSRAIGCRVALFWRRITKARAETFALHASTPRQLKRH